MTPDPERIICLRVIKRLESNKEEEDVDERASVTSLFSEDLRLQSQGRVGQGLVAASGS